MLPYWPDCELLRAGLQLLRLPHAVCSTAFVFLHRFKRASPSHDLLSSQAPLRTNDLVNAIHYLSSPNNPESVHAVFPALGKAQQSEWSEADAVTKRADILVGDAYYVCKQELISAEQLLLRNLNFEVSLDHPQKYLLNYCKTLHCSQAVVRLALCLANDCLTHTALCLEHDAECLAAMALHVASLLLGVAQELPHTPERSWWDALGLDLSQIEVAGHALLDALTEDGGLGLAATCKASV